MNWSSCGNVWQYFYYKYSSTWLGGGDNCNFTTKTICSGTTIKQNPDALFEKLKSECTVTYMYIKKGGIIITLKSWRIKAEKKNKCEFVNVNYYSGVIQITNLFRRQSNSVILEIFCFIIHWIDYWLQVQADKQQYVTTLTVKYVFKPYSTFTELECFVLEL